jgi:hypothetical protein
MKQPEGVSAIWLLPDLAFEKSRLQCPPSNPVLNGFVEVKLYSMRQFSPKPLSRSCSSGIAARGGNLLLLCRLE